jgi:hypothetical protein
MGDINWEGLMDEIGSDLPLSIDIFGGGSSPFSDINWEGLSDAVGSYIPFQDVFNLSDYLGDDWLKDIDLGTKGLDLSPAAEKILFEDLPYISSNFYGDDVVIPGQLGGFNPDAPPIGFNLGQDPGVWLDYYGYGAGDFMPDYFKDKEPVGGAHTTVDAALGPSGRSQINTTPGGGSTKNAEGPVKGLPGTPSGPSVRDGPGTTVPTPPPTPTRAPTPTPARTPAPSPGGTSVGGVLGGLAAAALLGKVLGLFDTSSSDKYTGIKMPKLSDIPKPNTPQIAPVKVVPVPVQVPVVSQDVKTALAKNLGSTELAHGGLARANGRHQIHRYAGGPACLIVGATKPRSVVHQNVHAAQISCGLGDPGLYGVAVC